MIEPIEKLTLVEVREAARRLSEVIVRTPLVPYRGGHAHGELWLKPEIHQRIGSFKLRGVFNAVARLDPEARARGLSTVSAGNTAQALAWCGQRFGVPASSRMPETAPAAKVRAVERLGGTPILLDIPALFRFLKEHLWNEHAEAFIHPWINRDVMIGHGTMALEIVEDCPGLATIYIPVGGGGLIGGVASALKALRPEVTVVAVEPQGCPALHASLKAGAPREVACKTICDGVAVPYITAEMYPLLASVVDRVALVSEARVREVVRDLAFGNGVVVEPSGALAAAAALDEPDRVGPCVAPLTGSSISHELFIDICADEVS